MSIAFNNKGGSLGIFFCNALVLLYLTHNALGEKRVPSSRYFEKYRTTYEKQFGERWGICCSLVLFEPSLYGTG